MRAQHAIRDKRVNFSFSIDSVSKGEFTVKRILN